MREDVFRTELQARGLELPALATASRTAAASFPPRLTATSVAEPADVLGFGTHQWHGRGRATVFDYERRRGGMSSSVPPRLRVL